MDDVHRARSAEATPEELAEILDGAGESVAALIAENPATPESLLIRAAWLAPAAAVHRITAPVPVGLARLLAPLAGCHPSIHSQLATALDPASMSALLAHPHLPEGMLEQLFSAIQGTPEEESPTGEPQRSKWRWLRSQTCPRP